MFCELENVHFINLKSLFLIRSGFFWASWQPGSWSWSRECDIFSIIGTNIFIKGWLCKKFSSKNAALVAATILLRPVFMLIKLKLVENFLIRICAVCKKNQWMLIMILKFPKESVDHLNTGKTFARMFKNLAANVTKIPRWAVVKEANIVSAAVPKVSPAALSTCPDEKKDYFPGQCSYIGKIASTKYENEKKYMKKWPKRLNVFSCIWEISFNL